MNRAEKRRQKKLTQKAQRKAAHGSSGVSRTRQLQDMAVQQSLDLGVKLHNSGDLPKAVSIYKQILQSDPNQPVALHRLGVIAHQAGNFNAASELISKAIENKPDFAEAYFNSGIVLKDLGQLEKAITQLQKAIELKPDYTDAQNNLGIALHAHGRIEEAVTHFQLAININSTSANLFNNLGNAHKDLGQTEQSISHYQKAIEINPDYAMAHYNLGVTVMDLGRIDESVASFRKAIEINPEYADARSNLLFSMIYHDCDLAELFNEHKLWSNIHANQAQIQAIEHERGTDPEKLLRVGFVSGDFREHSVTYFLKSFFEARNKNRVSFHCYSNCEARHEDEVSIQLREIVDGWRNISGQDDEAAAEMIRADQIDILVDLSGHSKGHRLPLFARKPAPIQATWLGYPDTTGLTAMDYRITDQIADPPGQSDIYNVEQLVRLDDGFLCYTPPEDAPDVAPQPWAKNGHVTFVSFNNLSKMTPKVVSIWAQILKAVPDAKLTIKTKAFSSAEARHYYQSLFEKESIEPGRLTLLGRSPSTRDHLDLYGEADIALDSFPYNGTTTTCEALWMGVPVIVLRGERHAARVGASLLTQVGLDSLIAENDEDYVEKAVALASDMTRLKALRKEMRPRLQKSSLCDSKGFAENMETAFRDMWTEYCR